MLELIALLVYLVRLVALARSRGRSPWWGAAGLLVWAAGDGVGWSLAPQQPLLASAIGVPLALIGAGLLYHCVARLEPRELGLTYGRGDNFPCPFCTSLQTEDRGGHLACHACGAAFGR